MACFTASVSRTKWLLLACALAARAQAPVPQTPPDRAELERVVAAQRHLLFDWGGLNKYGSEDAELKPPAPNENRVIFIGDDATADWQPFFPGKPYLNRGIARQSTPQMLVRFRQDVIDLKPKVVVIQGGTNDLAGFVGVGSQGAIVENFMSMVELAKVNGIHVVLASLLPVCDCYANQTKLRPQGKIIGLNGWLKDYAKETGSVYLNYYSALANGRDFRKELTPDGLVPNAAGYAAMAPLAEAAIAEALAKK
ncbi:MAG TPA: GDSL-type esterase/lipase family protein [Bryobacteraceae bacterium]|nr:GDSL-type esterase/lipase family protein [Bryobacteraceae bacterium]